MGLKLLISVRLACYCVGLYLGRGKMG